MPGDPKQTNQIRPPEYYINGFKRLRALVRPDRSESESREILTEVQALFNDAAASARDFALIIWKHRVTIEEALKPHASQDARVRQKVIYERLSAAMDALLQAAESYSTQGKTGTVSAPTANTASQNARPNGDEGALRQEIERLRAENSRLALTAREAETLRTRLANLTCSYDSLREKFQIVQTTLDATTKRLQAAEQGANRAIQAALKAEENHKAEKQTWGLELQKAVQARSNGGLFPGIDAAPQHLQALQKLAATGLTAYPRSLAVFVEELLSIAAHVSQEDRPWLLQELDRLDRYIYQHPERINLPDGPQESGAEILHLILSVQSLLHVRLEALGIHPIHPRTGAGFDPELHEGRDGNILWINDRPDWNNTIQSLQRIGFYDSHESKILRRAQVKRYVYRAGTTVTDTPETEVVQELAVVQHDPISDSVDKTRSTAEGNPSEPTQTVRKSSSEVAANEDDLLEQALGVK